MSEPINQFPARVVKVIANDKVVINRGSYDGIAVGQRFLLYTLDDEVLRDPDTGEELGRLEDIKGIGRVDHVQDRIAILFNPSAYFINPQIGDLAKPV